MLKRKPNRGQKSVNHRPRSVGPRELERNLEASVTPHPTAYQRMGALKRHRVASRELRFREKETGIRTADGGKAAAGRWDRAPAEIEHHNHTTHTHYTKAKQRRESKRGSLLGASADQIGEAGSGKGEEAERRRRRRRRGSKPFDEVGERGALRWVFIWCGWAERK
jgi:hypothetical protein